MDENMKAAVYVKTDESSRIIRCDGGYTTPVDNAGEHLQLKALHG